MYKISTEELKEINEYHLEKGFDNASRSRRYGVRIGDTVDVIGFANSANRGEVVGYGVLDNNSVYVQYPNGDICKEVAEWCEIVERVEDKISNQ